MTKTEKDLVTDALRTINVVAIDDEALGDIYEKSLLHYKAFHQWLDKEFGRDLYWDSNSVPEEVFSYLSNWFAGRLSDDIAIGAQTKQRVDNGAARAEQYLREILARRSIKPTQALYF